MPNSNKLEKSVREALQLGFNAGWLAAHEALARYATEQGNADFAKWLRERGKEPDKVEIVNMDDPVWAPHGS